MFQDKEQQTADKKGGLSSREPLYIFLHMPKCAGTTFRVHVENNLAPEEVLPLYVGIDKRYRDRGYVKEYVTSSPEIKKNRIKLVYGHEVHYGIHDWFGRPGKYFTFLRHPIPRTVSWYNYRRQKNWVDEKIIKDFVDKGKTPTIREWLDRSPWVWNEMTGYFADFGYCERKEHYTEEELNRILDLFFFVGLTETFDDDALFLYSILGIKKHFFRPQNISTKYFDSESDAKIEEAIRPRNEFDITLYESAAGRHSELQSSDRFYRRQVRTMRLRRAVSPLLRRLGRNSKKNNTQS